MCGIVGYIGPKKVVPVIIEGLRKLEYRGYDSAGIAVVDAAGKLEIRRASGKLRNLEEVIQKSHIEGTAAARRPQIRDGDGYRNCGPPGGKKSKERNRAKGSAGRRGTAIAETG